MAIIGIFEASISTGDGALLELNDSDSEVDVTEATKVVKYLQVTEGANFSIHFKLNSGFKFRAKEYVSIRIYLDGQRTASPVITKKDYKDGGDTFAGCRDGIKEARKSAWTIRKFKFGSLKLSEEGVRGRAEDAVAKYANLGEIRVEFWRKKGRATKGHSLQGADLAEAEDVPEKALKGKAVDLSVSLGQVEAATSSQIWAGKPVDKHPLATFIFKYRGEEALKQLGIIERTPTPVPLEERPIDELTPEELRELVKRQRAAEEAMKVKIKKEKATANLETLKKLKRERGDQDDGDNELTMIETPNKKRGPNPAEVIDLSMDG